jgi:hypothetical protein
MTFSAAQWDRPYLSQTDDDLEITPRKEQELKKLTEEISNQNM